MTTIRLTAAQAMVRFLSAQQVEIDGRKQRLFEGVFAIFGHGNVAGLGEALTPRATRCRPTAPITSRPWPMPRSPSPKPRGASG